MCSQDADLPNPETQLARSLELLDKDVTGLHADWILYRQLYGSGAKRIDLLNNAAASFFGHLQSMMLRDLTVSICRLLDRASTGSQENIVLETLVGEIAATRHQELTFALNERLAAARSAAKAQRLFRHKRVAHRDRKFADGDEQLPGFSRLDVEDVLHEIREFLNILQRAVHGTTTVWELTIMPADGERLLVALRKAAAYDAFWKDGTIPRDSIHKLPFGDE